MTGSVSSPLSSGLANAGLSSNASAVLANKAPSVAQAASTTGSTALAQLSGNTQTFLNLLMTQLKNQDPTTPMDTNQFTTELVQFSSVEQQINTNTSLTQLIQLTQAGALVQSSAMVGHTVAAANSDMPVQNGAGQISFTTDVAGPVTIAIYSGAGVHLGDSLVSATRGTNSWNWNAVDSSGRSQPDGAYKVVVTATDKTGASRSLPYNVVAQATGVVKNGNNLQLQLGNVVTDFSNVQSVMN